MEDYSGNIAPDSCTMVTPEGLRRRPSIKPDSLPLNPPQVIVVEDENGNIVRETMKDTDTLARYKTMHETLVYLSHLDHDDTEHQMLEKLRLQARARPTPPAVPHAAIPASAVAAVLSDLAVSQAAAAPDAAVLARLGGMQCLSKACSEPGGSCLEPSAFEEMSPADCSLPSGAGCTYLH